MNLLDSFVESFSARELKSRVRWVVALGIAIIAAASAAGYLFLSSGHSLSVEGAASRDPSRPGVIVAALSPRDFPRMTPGLSLSARFHPDAGIEAGRFAVSLLKTDPSKNEIELASPEFEKMPLKDGKFAVEIFLIDEPYWKLLWQRRQS